MTADEVIRSFNLQLHPGCTPQSGKNGSYFAEVYRSNHSVGSETRSTASHIFYLMKDGAVSFFHHLGADEMFHFHMGDSITIVELSKDVPGHTRKTIMGTDIRAAQFFFKLSSLVPGLELLHRLMVEEAGVFSVFRLRLLSSFLDLRVQ